MHFMTLKAMNESKPDVGSSQNKRYGLVINYKKYIKIKKTEDWNEECLYTSHAKASLFFSPPEIPLIRPGSPIKVSAHFIIPS